MNILMGLVGIITLLAIAVLLSDNRKAINLRTVIGAFIIQAAFAAFVLYLPFGQTVLQSVSSGVQGVINASQEGIDFLFGGLVSGKMFEVFGGGGFVFALRVLPIIVFFSSLIAVLYYLGVMQLVINVIGGALQKALGTSRPESLSATANIFVGQTEAPLVVRPFIAKMTQSELFAIMVGGLASVAGSVLAGYASLGVELKYLIAASFMAAPGGLLMAKIIKPETETPNQNLEQVMEDNDDQPANVIDAAASGAASGMQLALNVGAMLLAFIGLIALLNSLMAGAGHLFGYGNEATQAAFIALQSSASEANFAAFLSALADVAKVPVADVANQFTSLDRDLVINTLNSTMGSFQGDAQGAAQTLLAAASNKLSLQLLLGYVFAPLAFLIGVPWNEAITAGSFIGQKLVVNEFVAYIDFIGKAKELSAHTQAIVTFALCGFANLSSIAILLGGLGGMAPTRRHDIARMGIKAVLAGSLSNLMSATLAGLFIALAAL
ncbi:NupC/NupG family nucleoside CNT transporter [Gallaecimonas xiamenensis]|uniref:Nucleoside transporter n=1 Tax=Gallaecimonas xiamenensis 3-C-1 TaxID=745411 RepID=K2IQE4_9GAMM|nr:NupC/NupG family nucleoside CNT transporter [Gallaecimonas xiamenensis]EKE72411.1 nucleoside transporter [Gallaecimonas xiamenensis 3-C-1]